MHLFHVLKLVSRSKISRDQSISSATVRPEDIQTHLKTYPKTHCNNTVHAGVTGTPIVDHKAFHL